MEKIVEQGLLYDFYGELLTEHQRRIYEDAVCHNLSLAEIAEEVGISRQGVHDLIKRCDHTLKSYEERLHLIQRFHQVRQKVQSINDLTEDTQMKPELLREQIRRLSGEILEAL
ncbi:MAG: DNA-binding protein [Lachnospiraceae bacterium]|nr:DNA-binding protein [Lachnospiraceae bacterium]